MPPCAEIRGTFRELRGQRSTSGPGQTWESAPGVPMWGRQTEGSAPAPHSHNAMLLDGQFHEAGWLSSASGWGRQGTALQGSPSEGQVTQQRLRPPQTPCNALGGRILWGPWEGSASDPRWHSTALSEELFWRPGDTAALQPRVSKTPKPSHGSRLGAPVTWQHLRPEPRRCGALSRLNGPRASPQARTKMAPGSPPAARMAASPQRHQRRETWGGARGGKRREAGPEAGPPPLRGAGPAAGGRGQAPGSSQGLPVAAGRTRTAPYGSPEAAGPGPSEGRLRGPWGERRGAAGAGLSTGSLPPRAAPPAGAGCPLAAGLWPRLPGCSVAARPSASAGRRSPQRGPAAAPPRAAPGAG